MVRRTVCKLYLHFRKQWAGRGFLLETRMFSMQRGCHSFLSFFSFFMSVLLNRSDECLRKRTRSLCHCLINRSSSMLWDLLWFLMTGCREKFVSTLLTSVAEAARSPDACSMAPSTRYSHETCFQC